MVYNKHLAYHHPHKKDSAIRSLLCPLLDLSVARELLIVAENVQ
jgi:hypothetical protein